jgi:hypothetical protein
MEVSNKEETNEKRISMPTHTLNLDRVVLIGRMFSYTVLDLDSLWI